MVDMEKYERKHKGDTMIILVALSVLTIVLLYVSYSVLSIAGSVLPPGMIYLYVIFIVAILGVETIGFMQVGRSIKEHMVEFEYYD